MISAIAAFCFLLLLLLFTASCLRVDYAAATTAAILLLLVPQLMTALSSAVIPALALALLLAVIAQSAKASAGTQSARGVVVLGFSLAGTQLATPLGVVLAAILAPVLALHAPAGKHVRNAGLLVLLLFIPVVTAFVLAYLVREAGFYPARYFSSPFDFAIRPALLARMAPRPKGFAEAMLIAILALPVWLAVLRARRWTANAQAASALVAAVVIAALLARAAPLGMFLPSTAVLNALSFIDPLGDPLPPVHAVALSALSAMASWLFIVLPA